MTEESWKARKERLRVLLLDNPLSDGSSSDQRDVSEIVDLCLPIHHQLDRFIAVVGDEDTKDVTLDTRIALRVVLMATAVGQVREELHSLIPLLPNQLVCLMSCPADARCRLLGARLLCNLTSSGRSLNLLEEVPMAPDAARLEKQLKSGLFPEVEMSKGASRSPSWVEILANNSGLRDVVAAVVAALQNTLVAHDTPLLDPLLLATLLRQMVPVVEIVPQEGYSVDSATEWIAIVLVAQCQKGHLSDMFNSLSREGIVVPEQMVLLRCIEAEVVRYTDEEYGVHPLGCSVQVLEQSHCFLASIAVALSIETSDDTDSTDLLLWRERRLCAMTILVESLCVDTKDNVSLRAAVQRDTSILKKFSRELGRLLDSCLSKVAGVKARQMSLAASDQQTLVLLVRAIGCLCFKCRANQDALREIQVLPAPRTALHVLLSVTSLSPACFTLREWAIVSLRYALDENLENQQVVEELQSKDVVQSAALDELGVQISLNGRGEVKIFDSLNS